MQNSQSIFDPTGDLFFPSLYFCIGLVAFIVVVGIAAEFLYFRPSLCKRREKGETWWLIKLCSTLKSTSSLTNKDPRPFWLTGVFIFPEAFN